MDTVIDRLTESQAIFLSTHINPDGDAIGSLIALGLGLQQHGKHIYLYNASPIPAVYRFLPGVQLVQQVLPESSAWDTAVVLDCGTLDRIGVAVDFVRGLPQVINIDHHVTNTNFGQYRLVDSTACSSAEIVYRLLKKMAITIDAAIATSIYTGILTDTGSFRFANTNSAAYTICSEMVQAGVDPYTVAQHVYGTYSLGRIKLLNMALDSIEISANGKLSLMTLTQDMFRETDTNPEDVDGMINYAKRIEDVKVAALIMENENGAVQKRYHVSLRSDGTVDVAEIAASFGGGGHFSAAGFGVESSLKALKKTINSIAEKL
ncbi:MAG: bifunctional oligoribonuclease/PAP phosphatase NrnA [Desulfobacteraceae bacterium]|nr:bifunctional oligoribonuclease/PAP phosphatase NrnA [Desulfobacteraceae bacterium]MBC2753467.1 bifunctional oligoribonuclease/PAP phosphatase NrnA [Desulfobacteraceae bacterium]